LGNQTAAAIFASRSIVWNYFQAGHMMYIDSDSRVKLKKDMTEFILSALPTP
jgi:hypothetical protein